MAADKLTAKQARFVEEYLIDLNATQAAIRAGYSKNTANEIGCENLTKPSIQEAIQEAMQERSKRVEITQDMVLQKLWKIADDDIKNYLSFKTVQVPVTAEDGKVYTEYKTIVDLKDSDTIDTSNIAEISIGKDGQFKFKLYCKDHAAVNVGKHLGMFKDKVEFSGAIPVVIKDDIEE